MKTDEYDCHMMPKGIWHENQMLAKIHIVIPIDRQNMSDGRNHFLFVNHTSQTRDMEKNIRPISVLVSYHFYASLLANKDCIFSFFFGGRWRVMIGLLCVAGRIEFACPLAPGPVAFVQ